MQNVIARANSGRDQDILRAMAALKGEVKRVAAIGEWLEISPQRFGSNMTRLTREGIVRRERKGQYRFADPLLEIYVDRVGLGSAADDD